VAKHPKRGRKTPQRQRIFALNALPALSDDQVLTFVEWCALNGISPRTGRRILEGPDGPRRVQLSPRRFGIRVADNREWQHARARAESGPGPGWLRSRLLGLPWPREGISSCGRPVCDAKRDDALREVDEEEPAR